MPEGAGASIVATGLGFGLGFGAAGAAVVGAPSGPVRLPALRVAGAMAATGSPRACSRPTSRRGQAKSSARPAGADSGSPLTRVRDANGSAATGRTPGPPSNWSVPTIEATSGTIGPASGRGGGAPGTALASVVAGSLGSATGPVRAAISLVISRST